jgi:hypothetical protein
VVTQGRFSDSHFGLEEKKSLRLSDLARNQISARKRFIGAKTQSFAKSESFAVEKKFVLQLVLYVFYFYVPEETPEAHRLLNYKGHVF